MLNLPITMRPQQFSSRFSACLALLAALFLILSVRGGVVRAQDDPEVVIDSPGGGEVLQGVVTVTGTTEMEGFSAMEMSFAYQSDTTGTWFPIIRASTAVKEGPLATWDTTTISDGTYRLRVQVFLQDGKVVETVVDGLRVRNYLPIETATPGARENQVTPTPTRTPLPDFELAAVNATPLPTNPAVVTPRDLQSSAVQGALAAASVLGLIGLYLALKAAIRR